MEANVPDRLGLPRNHGEVPGLTESVRPGREWAECQILAARQVARISAAVQFLDSRQS